MKAYPHQRTEAFQDGHAEAFEFYGGVPRFIWYDNTKLAVAEITGGKGRVEQPGFAALRAHYLFEAKFCNPQEAHEKGIVENLVGYVRRNVLVPMPRVASREELNAYLRARNLEGLKRRVGRRDGTAGELLEGERAAMLPLPRHRMECCRTVMRKVNTLGLIQFERARYSVPVAHVGRTVCVKAFWDRIVIVDGEKVLAEHPRLYDSGESLQVEHYLPLLERKPSAVVNARVFRRLPPVYQAFRQRCLSGPVPRPREFLAVLRLYEVFAQPVVERALEQALEAGVILADAVRQLCLRQLPDQVPPPPLPAEKVPAMRSWSPDPGRYDALMGSVAGR